MPLFMSQFSYTPEAWAALARHPENRATALHALIQELGGQLIGFYYCFGDYDGMAIFECPTEATAMTALISAVAPGHVKAVKTTVLLTVEDAVAAMGNAQPYQKPK